MSLVNQESNLKASDYLKMEAETKKLDYQNALLKEALDDEVKILNQQVHTFNEKQTQFMNQYTLSQERMISNLTTQVKNLLSTENRLDQSIQDLVGSACEDMSSLLEQTLNESKRNISTALSEYSDYLKSEKEKMQEYLHSFYKYSAFRKFILYFASFTSVLNLIILLLYIFTGFQWLHL